MPSVPPAAASKRLVLSPIAWGTKDIELAKFACRAIVEATPAIVIRFNPFTQRRVRSFLTALRIHH